MEKEDNIEIESPRDNYTDSIDSYVLEESNYLNSNYYKISDNFKFEFAQIQKVRLLLDSVNSLCVRDVETLLLNRREIDELMIVLMDYQHTLNLLDDFEKVFKLKEVNGGVFVVKILKKHRRRRRRIKKKRRRRFKI